jgi:hypothetical protein
MRHEVETIATLRKVKASPNVVVMPDFFLDRLVTFSGSIEELLEEIMKIARQGGEISQGLNKRSLEEEMPQTLLRL